MRTIGLYDSEAAMSGDCIRIKKKRVCRILLTATDLGSDCVSFATILQFQKLPTYLVSDWKN